ncbi:MAG: iron-sulfur cluster carrier protein ApbC [Gammaproteobacteria bacterium]|nr:iron-sulfur cluster carrier protein ApbC [Gammaproteobacteria bacterium]MDE0612676.1 iron-sulfur cluster carrier protein ApbC [Gammaproteobacteria bacterium]
MALSKEQVEDALKDVQDPGSGQDLVTSRALENVTVDGDAVQVAIRLGYPAKGIRDELAQAVETRLAQLDGGARVEVEVDWEIQAHSVQKNLKPMENIKNVLAVASGKGGVGKSTTAINLALALSEEGASVGVLDADIYGPSQPRMLGISGQPESEDGKSLEPMMSHGLQAMSIGFLIDEETPMIWRGPMVTQALEQLLGDTRWRGLDYLVVDLPPGTGDVQLTLAQKIPVSGAIIVTTPQDIALLDARKGLKMFRKVEVPVLGVVENMSLHICSQCGHEEPIFGTGGGESLARESDVELLGQLPLDRRIREETDSGKPTVVAEPDGRISQIYRDIARRAAARLAAQAKDYSAKFPRIVIQND